MSRVAFWLLLLALPAAADEPPTGGRLRVLHAMPDLGAINVYVDGEPLAESVTYGGLSDYRFVPAGPHRFQAALAGEDTFLEARDATVAAEADATLALLPLRDEPTFLWIRDRVPADAPQGHLRAVHLADAPALALRPIGDPPIATLQRTQASAPVPVPAGDETYQLVSADDERLAAEVGPVTIAAGTTLSLFAIGRFGVLGPTTLQVIEDRQPWPDAEVYRQPAPPPAPAPLPPTRLRVLHLAPGVSPVAGTLDARQVLRDLGYGQVTEYLPVEPGNHDFRLTAGDLVEPGQVDLLAHRAHTLVLFDPPLVLNHFLLTDEPLEPAGTRLRIVQAIHGGGEVDVWFGGRKIAANLGFLARVDYQVVAEAGAVQPIEVRLAGQDSNLRAAEVQLEPGGIYTLYLGGDLSEQATDPQVVLKLLKDGRNEP